MKPILLAVCGFAFVALFCPSFTCGAEQPAAQAAEAAEKAEARVKVERLTIIQQRRMGLTWRAIADIAMAEQAKNPAAWSAMTKSDRAEAITQAIAAKNSEALDEPGAPDWKAIFAFVDKWLPTILRLFGIAI